MEKRFSDELITAIEKGDLESVVQFIGKGADVNDADHNGNTPLMYASMRGFTDTARFLLDNGADVNARNTQGVTPLTYACRNNQVGV